ncbi:MAG: ABC transporter permease [Propionibacteriaceae bacterium]|nr:ABC transporter permease [Propionibacteriaceae bacterium]
MIFGYQLNPAIQMYGWSAIYQTLGQVIFAALIAFIVGLPIGLLAYVVSPTGLRPNRIAHAILSVIVSLGRAIPFIALLVLLLPVTRWVVGTTLGWYAEILPLALGAIPFYARLVENALFAVKPGKVEAALMVGASKSRVAFDVLVRESLPALVAAATVTVTTLTGYSMITGTIGGEGLGALLYNYGYSRYMLDVMIFVVIAAVIIVESFQVIGDAIVRLLDHTH